MPELPEVETIATNLRRGTPNQPPLPGMIVSAGSVPWPSTLATPTIDEFQKQIPGQAITEISRRGKYLVIRL